MKITEDDCGFCCAVIKLEFDYDYCYYYYDSCHLHNSFGAHSFADVELWMLLLLLAEMRMMVTMNLKKIIAKEIDALMRMMLLSHSLTRHLSQMPASSWMVAS